MRLQTATRLALFAAIDLAGSPGVARSASDLAEAHHVSIAHMAKVMQALARTGLVAPSRGAQGGYRFAANARRTTLLDVIEQFEPVAVTGQGAEVEGASDDADAPVAAALDRVLKEIDDLARATLGSITLDTMLKNLARARDGALSQ